MSGHPSTPPNRTTGQSPMRRETDHQAKLRAERLKDREQRRLEGTHSDQDRKFRRIGKKFLRKAAGLGQFEPSPVDREVLGLDGKQPKMTVPKRRAPKATRTRHSRRGW